MKISRLWFIRVVLFGMLCVTGCDEGLTPTGIDREVMITPTEVTLNLGEVQPFDATVIGMTDTIVVWSVDGGAGWGTISETGLFTAPTVLPAAAFRDPDDSATIGSIATVRATCRNHPLVTGQATVRFWAPEFALLDVNETSDTYGELIGPQDHAGRITAWYFGHASS
jgi:hypothetical protein